MIRWTLPEHLSDAELLAEWEKLEPDREIAWADALSDEIDKRGLDI